MYLLHPQTVNPVQATKGSLLIAIVFFWNSISFSKKEGNEKEGEIVSSIGIDPHDRFVVEIKLFFEKECNEKEGEITLSIAINPYKI